MADLLIIVPTRRRRANLDRFLDAFDATREADTDLLVVTDDDDDDSYGGLTLPAYGSVACGPRAWLTPKLNRHAVPAASVYPAVGFFGDDCVTETPGWDTRLLAALDSPGVAWPAGERRFDLGEHEVISSVIIRALGWYFQPSLMHYWTDNVWHDLGTAAGCYRHVDVLVRHQHYVMGGQYDQTYQDAEQELNAVDSAAYRWWKDNQMSHDVAVVRSAIEASAGIQ